MGYFSPQKQFPSVWRDPKVYGKLGLALVAGPSLLFFFAGRPMAYYSPEKGVTGITWEGTFQPFLLYFVGGAAVAAWGCHRNTRLAWLGSLFVLALSILTLTSVGIFTFPGAVILLIGTIARTLNKESTTLG